MSVARPSGTTGHGHGDPEGQVILVGTKSPCVPMGWTLCAINSGQTKQTEFMSVESKSIGGVYRLRAPREGGLEGTGTFEQWELQNEREREPWTQTGQGGGQK